MWIPYLIRRPAVSTCWDTRAWATHFCIRVTIIGLYYHTAPIAFIFLCHIQLKLTRIYKDFPNQAFCEIQYACDIPLIRLILNLKTYLLNEVIRPYFSVLPRSPLDTWEICFHVLSFSIMTGPVHSACLRICLTFLALAANPFDFV